MRELGEILDPYLCFSNFSSVFKLSVANFLWFPCSKNNFKNIFIYFKLTIGKKNKYLFLVYKVCFNPLYKIQLQLQCLDVCDFVDLFCFSSMTVLQGIVLQEVLLLLGSLLEKLC